MAPHSDRLLAAGAMLVEDGLEMVVLLDALGTVVAASPGIFNKLGLAPAELAGHPMVDCVHPADQTRLAAGLAVLAQSAPDTAVQIEYRVSHAARTRWLRTIYVNRLADPAIAAIVATCQDVTEYHQACEAIVANTLDALLLCDDQMRYVEANPAACKLIGRTRDQILQMTVRDVTPDARREALPETWQNFIAVGTAVGEYPLLRADGTQVRVEGKSVANILPGIHLSAMRDISSRLAAQQQAQLIQEQLQNLTGRLLSVQMQERHRVAREVHDELGQLLTALKLDLSWSKRRLNEGRATAVKDVAARCERMSTSVASAIVSIRRIAAGLYPAELDQIGLVAAVETYARQFGERVGIVVRVRASVDDEGLGQEIGAHLLRITQEATTNISRHARASEVEITLDQDVDHVTLVVSDNGCGMEALPTGSLGFLSMRERARLCGGELIVESTPGRGTSIRVRVPIDAVRAVSGGAGR